MLYNIHLEVASAVYMMIICLFLRFRYNGRTQVSVEFQKVVYLALILNIMDVVTGITISYSTHIPNWINIILNTMYFVTTAMLGYRTLRYMTTYIWPDIEKQKSVKVFRVFHIVYVAVLLVNMFTGWIFEFSESGEYIHGSLYTLVYGVPFFYTLCCLFVLFLRGNRMLPTQKIFCFLFVFLSISGALVQVMIFPHILISAFSISLGIVLMMFSLETPDYQKLLQTMEELKQTKTRAEEAQRLAQEADQAKSAFLGNMSHEFRTPINAVLGYNGMIMREAEEKATRLWAGNVQAAGRTLLSMVNNILDFSALMDGTLQVDQNVYSTLSLLQDTVLYAEHNTEEKGLEFRYKIAEGLPQKLLGDESRMTQVLNNLLTNALKYTREGWVELRVAWERTGNDTGLLTMQVRDTGVGMKEEDIAKISESFARFDEKKNRDIQRIGLGLSMVAKLVEQISGTLKIESEYGKGSAFTVQLEQQIVDGAPIGTVDFGRSGISLKTEWDLDSITAKDARILVADDHQMNLDLFAGMLRSTGIQMETAENGEEAIKRLEKHTYDLVFLDHMMPVMDGVETLKEIRKRQLCAGVPIIVVTANAVSGSKGKYLEEGFDDYLSKPVRGRELHDLLKKYLPAEKIKLESSTQQERQSVVPVSSENAGEAGNGLLSRIPFLDTETGMAYCGDSEEFYEEMLTSYINSGKYEDIAKAYENKDWDAYRILVHALKSTSLAIGAVDVSEQAKGLEQAVKEERLSFVEEHHQESMKAYKTLLQNIQNALQDKESTQEEQKLQVLEDTQELMHILVVDDDDMNLQMAERMLLGKFKVSCAKSGEDALSFLEQERPDMILLDLHMPGMDGFEVMDRLRRMEECKDIPVIFLTADNDRNSELEGFKQGAMDFITKPFIADIMVQRISRILQLDRLQKQMQHEVRRQTKKAEDRREQVERLSLQVVKALANVIDAKDRYTNGHSTRVAEYSREIARRLGKTESEQSDIYYMALLHDIGKIGIPDFIINKQGKLTENEYRIIQTHSVIGGDILKNISEMPGIEIGARWHHERYDGEGYPDGLKGEEIPEMARIICVADAYDAMTSDRSYRGILPQRVARQEIEDGRGTQFDARMADIMLQMIDEDPDFHMQGSRQPVDS